MKVLQQKQIVQGVIECCELWNSMKSPFGMLNELRMLISNGKCEVKDQLISIVSFPMDLESLIPCVILLMH